MIQENNNILAGILSAFRQQLSNINAQIHRNLLYIKEEETCVKNLENTEDDELKMFYPRIDNDFQKDEIEKANNRKIDYEKRNEVLYERKTLLEGMVEQMEIAIGQEDQKTAALNFQEEECKRISSDLHDTALQNLVHLIHKIELCNLYIDEDPIKAKLELALVSKSLKEIVDDIRDTVFDFYPMTFDDLGLKASFERLLDNINNDNRYEIISDIDDVSCENDLTLLYIYRVVQESLKYVVKHTEAKKILFYCKSKDNVCVIDIEDDGKEFYEEQGDIKDDKYLGFSLIKERIKLMNGKISISSFEGDGTKIHMEIPLKY